MITRQNALYLESFLEMLAAERGVARNTLESYNRDIRSMLLFIQKRRHVAIYKVDHKLLLDYVNDLYEQSLSSNTVMRRISSIRQFFNFLLSEEVIDCNPALLLEMPKKKLALPKALSEKEMQLLLEAARKDQSAEGIRNMTMLEILYSTGMRISELVSLTVNALERSTADNTIFNCLLINGKGDKERIVILNEVVLIQLQRYLPIREKMVSQYKQSIKWLFPSVTKSGKVTHISRQRFGQVLKNIAIENGMDHSVISPHKIRHSFASHMLKNGANIRVIQELMGHSSINSTQIYTKVYQDMAVDAVERHPLNKKKSGV